MRSTHFLIAALTLSFSPLPSICETPLKAQSCYIAVLSDVLSWDRGAGAALSHAHTGAGCSILTHKPQPRVPSSVAPRPLRQAVQAPAPPGELTWCTFGVLRLLRRWRALVESASLTVTAWKFEDNVNISPSIAEVIYVSCGQLRKYRNNDHFNPTCHLLPHIYKIGNFL